MLVIRSVCFYPSILSNAFISRTSRVERPYTLRQEYSIVMPQDTQSTAAATKAATSPPTGRTAAAMFPVCTGGEYDDAGTLLACVTLETGLGRGTGAWLVGYGGGADETGGAGASGLEAGTGTGGAGEGGGTGADVAGGGAYVTGGGGCAVISGDSET